MSHHHMLIIVKRKNNFQEFFFQKSKSNGEVFFSSEIDKFYSPYCSLIHFVQIKPRLLYLFLFTTSWSARPWRKKFDFWKKKIEIYLAYVTPGVLKSSLKNLSPFGIAVWPAMANIYRVSQKKFDLRRLVQNCTFFVQLSCMVFFQYFLKICNIFGTPMLQWPNKKIHELFFPQNQKFRKAKICI